MYYDFIMSNTRYFRLPVFLLLAILLSACSDDDDSGGTGNVTKTGQTLYDENCASCHGADGTGGTVNFDLTVAGVDVSAVGITDAISTVPDMNSIILTATEIQSIADYLAGSTSGSVTNLIGGAIQGIPLDLAAVVTTLKDSTGVAAKFNSPRGITTDGTNLYVTDGKDQTVDQFVIATGVVTTLAGTAAASGFLDGTGLDAQFNVPSGITTDGTNLYVTDYDNQTVRQIVIATGVVTTLAGSVGIRGSMDGTGLDAQFDGPQGITTDGTNLYVVDSWNATIRQIVIASGEVTTLAGTATVRDSADGIGVAAQFNSPYDITTDGTNLYVADFGNQTVRQIVIASRVVTTLVGTAGVSGSDDATGAAALFNSLGGITTDGTNLYVTELNNKTVRKIVISTGVVTTLVGTALLGGSEDGTGAMARFESPLGITTDGINLYVADFGNQTVRQID